MARHLTRALTCAMLFVGMAAAGVGGATPAQAAQRGSVGVAVGHYDPKVPDSMGHFILTLPPGGTYADDVIVTNHNDTPFPVYSYPADAGTSDASGEFYGARTDPLRKAGAWVTSSVTSVTVPAKSQVRVAFTVKVPPDATPGDHLAAMVFEPEHPETGEGGMGVSAIIRAAMPILVQVPGPGSFHIALSGATIQPREGTHTSSIFVLMTNDGNRKGKPVVSVQLTGPKGFVRTEPAAACPSAAGAFCGQMDYVLPGDSIHFPFPWTTDLASGDYTITVTASWGPGPTDHAVFNAQYHLGAALAGTPLIPVAPHAAAAGTTGQDGFFSRLGRRGIAILGILIALAVAGFGLALRKRRCTHCGGFGLTGRFTARDYHEIAGCASCRAKATERITVVLCQKCYRTHVANADGVGRAG